MVHLGVYVIENAHDALLAERHDVFNFEIDACECENCGIVIGPSLDKFFPCVVIVDIEEILGDDAWAICLDCAAPLVYPNDLTINLELS